ncbi:hypothetical protein SLW70_07430 [Flavobacterium sp. NG2]|uniref:hypothetical protein n=1 Tax=Flavobacterium sp. NG2 TaxID=3097547 RepID=UPI002A83D6CE|nr:hypothetical protein [Flavobacterium sp. NG2]WPR72942.1 hypothetical protein SLW70_07430 [Flavobacterium sp. NG2]
MLNQAPVQEPTLVGGWSPFQPLTAQDKEVFSEALNGFVGVSYTPNSVSTQIVAGTNYRYKCTASMPPSEVIWEAVVEIFAPLNGKPYITGIVRI